MGGGDKRRKEPPPTKGVDTGTTSIVIPGLPDGADSSQGEWVLVRRTKPGRVAGAEEGGAGTERGSQPSDGKAVSRTKVTPALQAQWRKERKCLRCGASDHYVRKCPSSTTATTAATKGPKGSQPKGKEGAKGSQPTTKPNGSGRTPAQGSQPVSKQSAETSGATRKAKPKAAPTTTRTPSGGQKRARETAPSGHTPPAKKVFSYAKAAAGSQELAIVMSDTAHVRRALYERLRDAAEETVINDLKEGKAMIQIDGWSYTNQVATVHVADSQSATRLSDLAAKEGMKLLTAQELAAVRKPTKILTGLVTGPAARKERAILDLYVKAQKECQRIPGRMEVCQTFETKAGNLLMKLVVDEEAMSRLKEIDHTLRIGASGLVKFADVTEGKRLDNVAAKNAALAKRKEELKEKEQALRDAAAALRQAERDAEEAKETESVGSLGAGALSLADADLAEQMETVLEETEEAAKEDGGKSEKTGGEMPTSGLFD